MRTEVKYKWGFIRTFFGAAYWGDIGIEEMKHKLEHILNKDEMDSVVTAVYTTWDKENRCGHRASEDDISWYLEKALGY